MEESLSDQSLESAVGSSNSMDPRHTSSSNRRGREDSLTAGLESASGHLGTLNGVLIPTCENMWGVLIFLRFYVVVGNAGVWQTFTALTLMQTFTIVMVSFLCSLLTTLSLSAVATNGKAEEGGTYYLISRALGPRIGGAVGCMYYLGVALLAVLETLGAVEMLLYTFPGLHIVAATRILSTVLLIALGILVFCGIKFVSRLGVLFFGVCLYTMASFYIGLALAPKHNLPAEVTGLSLSTLKSNWDPGYKNGMNYSAALSVFFPCFTGILSGADRASSLRNPATAIPVGTLGAICVSLVIYLSYFGLWGAVALRPYLLGDLSSGHGDAAIVSDIVWPSAIVTQLGIIIASISQVLQCLVTAPRLIQAISADGVVPFLAPLARLRNNEPQRALIFTVLFCVCASMIGSLDLVAPLTSVCFLTCYAALNLSCLLFTVLKAPSWRPSWRYYSWVTALAGFLGCFALMFAIVWYWALAAIFLAALLYIYIDYRQVQVDWGTGLGGLRLQLAVQAILSAGRESKFSVNWRPQLLVLAKPQKQWDVEGSRNTDNEILSFASQLKKGKGLCVVNVILEGKLSELAAEARKEQEDLEARMEHEKVAGFARALVAASYRQGKTCAIQTGGLGSLEPNTLLLGWPDRWQETGHRDSGEIFLETLAECTATAKAALVCMHIQNFPRASDKQHGFIDVWWIVHDGGLLLLLAHLLSQHRIWRACKLRVHTVAEQLDNSVAVKANLQALLQQVRIEAEVEVVEMADEDLAPYTYDYTMRVEEAQAHLDGLAAARRDKADKPAAVLEKAGSFAGSFARRPEAYLKLGKAEDMGMLQGGITPRAASMRAKSGPLPRSFPPELHMVEGAAHVSRQTSLRRSGELVLQIDDVQAGKAGPSVHNRRSSTGSSGDEELPRTEEPMRRRSVVEGAPGLRALSSAAARESFRNSGQLDAVLGAPNRGGATPRARPRAESITGEQDAAGFGEGESRRASRFGEVSPSGEEMNGLNANGALQGPSMRDGKLVQTRFAGEVAVGSPLGDEKLVKMTGTALNGESVKLALRQMQAAARERPNPLERTWDTFTQAHTPKRLNDLIREKSEGARLVLINLPDPHMKMDPDQYMGYCEELTAGLNRILLVHGTGKEVWSSAPSKVTKP